MTFDEILGHVGTIPFTSPERGRQLYDHVIKTEPAEILELGFAHGTSTCYLAAALDALGGDGRITTIDVTAALDMDPNLPTLLERTGLAHRVDIVTPRQTYNWSLMRIIEEQTVDDVCEPRFDFCFIDGGHNWDDDGLAFMLVAKLLRPGGWVCFDDINWTFEGSPAWRNHPFLAAMDEDERTTPQVERVFNLLVKQHPDFTNFEVVGAWPWGWAQKRPT